MRPFRVWRASKESWHFTVVGTYGSLERAKAAGVWVLQEWTLSPQHYLEVEDRRTGVIVWRARIQGAPVPSAWWSGGEELSHEVVAYQETLEVE